MPVYASTIFISAFLVFLIQPILARVILPWFGGAAGVWATSLLFFQTVLLLGYLYAYWSVQHLSPRVQSLLHFGLIAVSALLLPVVPDASWKPIGDEEPSLRILGLLGASVGLQYFLLSTTGPLMQAWYAASRRVAFPYRLFALSNLGSLLALLAYPVVVEPLVTTSNQLRIWSGVYIAFLALCAGSVLLYWKSGGSRGKASAWDESQSTPRPGWSQHLLWLALAACASTLLLAVTNYITSNIAAIPLLWVLPLSLYLLSFILCFDRAGWYRPRVFQWLLPVTLIAMVIGMFAQTTSLGPKPMILLFVVGLFLSCMFCHGELAGLKPHARHLTSFYLMVSLGGALGGLFVGLLAPLLLSSPLELPIGVALCAVLSLPLLYRYPPKRLIWVCVVVPLAFIFSINTSSRDDNVRVTTRDFYGSIWVGDVGTENPRRAVRSLRNGNIIHGFQFLDPDRRDEPTTYYGRASGVGVLLGDDKVSNRRVGVIGLGVGTLAAYGRPGDTIKFYEINPTVVQLARSEFTFLQDSAATIEVVLGDARLALERESPQQFDTLVIDAFSADSIPVHLLTREAFELYFRHLKADGDLAVHISNRYVNLFPLMKKMAATLHKDAVTVQSQPDGRDRELGASWVLMNAKPYDVPQSVDADSEIRLWTDDYSNLLAVLK